MKTNNRPPDEAPAVTDYVLRNGGRHTISTLPSSPADAEKAQARLEAYAKAVRRLRKAGP